MCSCCNCSCLTVCHLIFFQVIDVDLPITVKLTVVDVDPGLKGDTAQGDTILFILQTSIIMTNLYCKHCKPYLYPKKKNVTLK